MHAPLLKYRILPTARIGIDELRSYVVRTFGWETWRQTSAQIQQTITHVRQFPESGHVPAELEGFIDDNFRQALFRQEPDHFSGARRHRLRSPCRRHATRSAGPFSKESCSD